jgi:hypothetical protein
MMRTLLIVSRLAFANVLAAEAGRHSRRTCLRLEAKDRHTSKIGIAFLGFYSIDQERGAT